MHRRHGLAEGKTMEWWFDESGGKRTFGKKYHPAKLRRSEEDIDGEMCSGISRSMKKRLSRCAVSSRYLGKH